jgi:predicted lysophospholipase L1 biosynthesis ABC-type transport system permease subunit
VVGVVGSTRWSGVDQAPEPIVYFPLGRLEGHSVAFVLRTRVDPENALPTVRHVVAELDPEIPIARVEPLTELHRRSLGPLVPLARAVAAAALFAALLATSATAALLAALVLRRRQELALRLALGAQPLHLRRLVLGEGVRLALGGLLVGLATAALTTPLLRRALDFSDTLGPWPYAVAALCLLASALLGAALPATLAGRIDPARALREE